MIDPLPPSANAQTITAKLNELIGAFNERVDSVNKEAEDMIANLPRPIRNRVERERLRNNTP